MSLSLQRGAECTFLLGATARENSITASKRASASNPAQMTNPRQGIENSKRAMTPLRRGFLALEALAANDLSASDLARLLHINRSTALRLLGDLEATGYIARDPISKHYRNVSSRFLTLAASSASDRADWSEMINPILADLRDEFGEASILGVPANGTMVYLAFFPSVHLVAVRERLGTTRPMHCSALGKAYLSALPESELDLELGRMSFRGGAAAASKGPIELRERLAHARETGYAMDRSETFEGASCVAVPVRINGALIGAMGLSGPSTRFSDERIHEMGERLRQTVLRL